MPAWHRILAVSRVIYLDGVRRYTLLGLLIFFVLAESSGLMFLDFFGHDVGRASSDFLFSIMWLAGLVFLLFHAVQVIAHGEEIGIIHVLISRPISRGEYVLGVYTGLTFLLFSLQFLLGLLAFGSLSWIRHLLDPAYFPALSAFNYLLAWSGLVAMQLMFLAAIMFFSGLVRGGFPVLVISIAYYFICSGLPVVRESYGQQMGFADSPHLSDFILRGMTAIFPDFGHLDFKDTVISTIAILHPSHIATNFLLAILYIALLLLFACLAYNRRDL